MRANSGPPPRRPRLQGGALQEHYPWPRWLLQPDKLWLDILLLLLLWTITIIRGSKHKYCTAGHAADPGGSKLCCANLSCEAAKDARTCLGGLVTPEELGFGHRNQQSFVTPEELGANPNQAERREAKASAGRPEASCGGRGGHPLMQALSHFSFHNSNGEYLLCDLQGRADADFYTLTDAALLCSSATTARPWGLVS